MAEFSENTETFGRVYDAFSPALPDGGEALAHIGEGDPHGQAEPSVRARGLLPHLFTVLWWLLIIGSVGCWFTVTWIMWNAYRSIHDPDPSERILYVKTWVFLFAGSSLPFATMTLFRWVATGRWRFGPCW